MPKWITTMEPQRKKTKKKKKKKKGRRLSDRKWLYG